MIVVVGGGVVGAACAYELARDGHEVTVVDRHDQGRATDAGAGILSPETYSGTVPTFLELADLAGAHYRALVDDLATLGSPGLADATFLEVRVGLRPVSDDDLPIIGALPAAPHVYVATGLGANGLLLGPVTGRVVADLVSS